ncbi:MAG: tRNA uridine-5-carboxymethylaminomethyl(34) synthesis GTPase MnmE [Oscillospiraceae bacterium]|nr:tRNA uridine-5-carboxymethylaminomethyl(34) synthesis GTPase MnmE [Oscillospiraceae bacterium]MCI9317949.1 tRNA uridine-5-carboxymethylaminomethyl(34) synthesis GTPase MnmE [Oscillospiraceae bacterium]
MEPIAAISTGNALSAIGILRISGEGCFDLCDRVFRPRNGRPFSRQNPREMVLGSLLDREGRTIDACLAVRFPGPRSYTGEDCAEFHCHGSPVVLDEGLRALFAAGARQADRGEFTRRAFLSGNLDLTQAEAVIDLIEAETVQAARSAAGQLDGALREPVEAVRGSLLDITSQFCAVVDYPDEDIEDLGREEILRTLEQAERTLSELLAAAHRGQLLRQGVPTVILGRPNAGKSSLLNALLGYDRAIVTAVAGTTRDTVEEKAVVGGVLLRLIDTAGIRDAEDEVERIGVERSRQAAARAELALLVLDGSQPLAGEDRQALEAARLAPRRLVLRNKIDLPQVLDSGSLEGERTLPLSARTGQGLDGLEAAVAELFPAGKTPPGRMLANARQAEAVSRALRFLRGAREALESGLTPDVVLTDAEGALNALGELTGRTLREDLTARIFERFCVGK